VDGDSEIEGNDRWWVAGGADWHFASTVYRPRFRLHEPRDCKGHSRVVPFDALLNVRWCRPVASVPCGGAASPRRWHDGCRGSRLSFDFAWERARVPGVAGVVRRRGWGNVFRRTYATAETQSTRTGPHGPFAAV
jgi:hypothetical protein